MIAQAYSATSVGIEALPIVVEVDLMGNFSEGGERNFILVGLPDKAVQESRERVRAAMKNSGFGFPARRIMCNLAPGDLRKEGPWLDLPMAIGILATDGVIPFEALESTLLLGELGLDGVLRPVDGAVSVALMAAEKGFRRLVLPVANATEAAVATGVEVFGVRNLVEAVETMNGGGPPATRFALTEEIARPRYEVDFADVKGQRHAVRALEVSAAGAHNLLMTGPPGSGKTMLARRLPTILPPLALSEAVEVTRIHSSAGTKGSQGLIWERPFRSPHHSASYAAVVGGGKNPKPGEVSLGHHGVLFMDEMPEFDRTVLEALRQPLEDGVVTVARVANTLTFPAGCILVGAMNPCPCGFRGLPEQNCVGSPATCVRYAGKLSGPLMDRIDLHLEVPRLKPDDLLATASGEPSEAIRERVLKARDRQTARLGEGRTNGRMSPREIRETIELGEEERTFMRTVTARLNLSARVFDRVLKVGRTLADLAGDEMVTKRHLAEAVQFRERTEF